MKTLKVFLVKPDSDMHVVLPPIGLGYLASYCQREVSNIDLKIIDCHKDRYSPQNFKDRIKEFKPDVIGFTALSMEIDSTLRLCSAVKEISDDIVTIIGGPHASAAPESLLSHETVDYIFRGEGEKGFSWFLKNLFSSERLKSPGLGYRDGDNIVLNEPEFVDDINNIPFPDYKKMRLETYPKMYFMRRFPAAPVISSRGCPFSCTFCAGHKVSGRRWRPRSVEGVIEEISWLHREYGIREIDFWDDNFTLDKARVERFCKEMRQLRTGIIWWCPNGVHLNAVDKDLLIEMKQSGCYAVAFGVESGSENIRMHMKKMISFERLKETVEFSNKIGLRTQGFFIIGYPLETEEDIAKTIRLSVSLPFVRASFLLFQPILGSDICEWLLKNKTVDERDPLFTRCDYSKASLSTEYIKDISRIKWLQRKAILKFYLRPKVFLRVVFDNLSLSQIKELIDIVRKYIIR